MIDKISFFHPAETIDWSTFDSVEFNLRKKIKKEKREKKIKSEWTRFTVGESINTESIGRRTGGSGSVPRGAAVTSHITLYMESIQLWSQVYSKALPTSASMLSSLRGLFTFQKQPRYSPNFLHPVRFFKAERIKVSRSFLNRNNWTRSRAFWWHSRMRERNVSKKCNLWIGSLPFSSKIGTPPKTVAKQHHRKAMATKKTAK